MAHSSKVDHKAKLLELKQGAHLASISTEAKKVKIPEPTARPKLNDEVLAVSRNLKRGDGLILVMRFEKSKSASAPENYDVVQGVVATPVNSESSSRFDHVAWMYVIDGPPWIPKDRLIALPQDGSLQAGDTHLEYYTIEVLKTPEVVPPVTGNAPTEKHALVFATRPDDEDDSSSIVTSVINREDRETLQGNIATIMNAMNPEGVKNKEGRDAPGWKLLIQCPPAVSELRAMHLKLFIDQTFTGLGVDERDKADVRNAIAHMKLAVSQYVDTDGGILNHDDTKAVLKKHIVILHAWWRTKNNGLRKEVARKQIQNFSSDPWPDFVVHNEFETYAREHALKDRDRLTLYPLKTDTEDPKPAPPGNLPSPAKAEAPAGAPGGKGGRRRTKRGGGGNKDF